MTTPLYSNFTGFRAFRRLQNAQRQPRNPSVLLDEAMQHTTPVNYNSRSQPTFAEWVDSQNASNNSELESFAEEANEASEEALPSVAENATSSIAGNLSDFDFAGAANIVDSGLTSILDNQFSQGLQDQINSVANQKTGPFSFLQTDKQNQVAAMTQQAQQDVSNRQQISEARGIGTAIATLFGPEVSIPYTIGDMLLGSEAELFGTTDDLTKVNYNKVITYGDFGNDINNYSGANLTPQALQDSVLSTNINQNT